MNTLSHFTQLKKNTRSLGPLSVADDSSIAYGENCSASSYSTAIGAYNEASDDSHVLGAFNTASGYGTTIIGYYNTASDYYGGSLAIGSGNSSTDYSMAIGFYCTSSGNFSVALGTYANTSVDQTMELNVNAWNNSPIGRFRLHNDGRIHMSLVNSISAPTDGGTVAGSEIDGTLGRNLISFRRNGLNLFIDFNDGGTIRTLSLGTFS